jgi:hypothetical protein
MAGDNYETGSLMYHCAQKVAYDTKYRITDFKSVSFELYNFFPPKSGTQN